MDPPCRIPCYTPKTWYINKLHKLKKESLLQPICYSQKHGIPVHYVPATPKYYSSWQRIGAEDMHFTRNVFLPSIIDQLRKEKAAWWEIYFQAKFFVYNRLYNHHISWSNCSIINFYPLKSLNTRTGLTNVPTQM